MSTSTSHPKELIDQLRLGDRRAFTDVYEQYKDGLFHYCCSMLKDRQAAEDVVHDVFINIWTKKHTLMDASAFRSWVFSIARHRALAFLRDRKPFEELSEDLSQDDDSPLELAINQEKTEMLDGLLCRLRPAYRELILLRIEGEFSYEEIAGMIGKSQAAVRTHLFRARKALAKVHGEIYGRDHDRNM
jgi:RNA polymerase sigma-70 factor (ECF subfamily)